MILISNITMTQKETNEAIKVMSAYVNGKKIQYLDDDGRWVDTPNPVFDWSRWEYRVNPKPEYRPFESQEECWNEMLKHQPFGWVRGKYSAVLYHIDSIASDRVVYAFGNHMNFDFIIKNYEFADGTPFGISED